MNRSSTKDWTACPARPSDSWIGIERSALNAELRLVAIPYAGGGASAFRRWPNDLACPDWLAFAALQLPGREGRAAELPLADAQTLLDRLAAVISDMADVPLVLFGYSLGAGLAYELAIRLASTRPLRGLVLAARAPPFRASASRAPAHLSREAVIAKIRKLGGTAVELIGSEIFDQHFLPILQADFAVASGLHRSLPQILPCPIVALAATHDPDVTVDEVRRWEAAAGGGFELHVFEGGHFFLHDAHPQVIALLNRKMSEWRP